MLSLQLLLSFYLAFSAEAGHNHTQSSSLIRKQTYIYDGAIGEERVRFILHFDIGLVCPAYQGHYFYLTKPEELHSVRGVCGYVVCKDRQNQYPSGPILYLDERQKRQTIAKLHLCPKDPKLERLEGWIFQADCQAYQVWLDLVDVIER